MRFGKISPRMSPLTRSSPRTSGVRENGLLSAQSGDVGNTSGTHMGNTFSALIATRIAVGEADERLHTLSQTPFLRPLEVCDKVCSRSCKMFISLRQNRKCYPCVRSNCYQRPRPQPSPALSSRGVEGDTLPVLGACYKQVTPNGVCCGSGVQSAKFHFGEISPQGRGSG